MCLRNRKKKEKKTQSRGESDQRHKGEGRKYRGEGEDLHMKRNYMIIKSFFFVCILENMHVSSYIFSVCLCLSC